MESLDAEVATDGTARTAEDFAPANPTVAETSSARAGALHEVCITNAGMWTKQRDLLAMLVSAGIAVAKLSKMPKAMTAYLYLRTVAEKDDALAKIPTILIKGKALLGRYNGLIAPSSQESEPNAKRPRSQISSTSASTGAAPISATSLADAVVPWHNVPYEEQLERKHKEIQSALRTFTTKLRAHVWRRLNLQHGYLKAITLPKRVEALPVASTLSGGTSIIEASAAPFESEVMVSAGTSSAAEVGDAGPPSKRMRSDDGDGNPANAGAGVGAATGTEDGENARVGSEGAVSHPTLSAPQDHAEAAAATAASAAPVVAATATGTPNPLGLFDPTWADGCNVSSLRSEMVELAPAWLLANPRVCGMQACPTLPIVGSVARHGYRNKIELTIGHNAAGQVCVGHRLAEFAASVVVEAPTDLPNLPQEAKALAAAIETFLRASPLPPYNVRTHEGVWRAVIIRLAASASSIMVIVATKKPTEESGLAVTYAEQLQGLTVTCMSALPAVKCVFVQDYDGVSTPPPNHPFTLLGGDDTTIQERVCGKTFHISPGAFFQVNSPSAEVLFTLIRSAALDGEVGLAAGVRGIPPPPTMPLAPRPRSVLLDVCCGTGTIGLVCADAFEHVFGIELSEAAVADARRNASVNGITNATFYAEKAEDALKRVLDDIYRIVGVPSGPISVTAVVDPPRGGLHPAVIRALRTCKPLKRLVYVSCNPTGSFIEDALKLTSPNDKNSSCSIGPPFVPIIARPLDMFPDTPHTELITVFERS